MDPSTKKDKRYYSTAQLYQLVNLQSFSVRGKAHSPSQKTSTMTNKQLVVHYDRLKPFKEPPPTSNVSTRDTSAKTQSQTQSQETIQKPTSIDHDQCNWSYSFTPPPTSLTTTSTTSTPSTPTAVS